jgi:hypothetical protein
MGDLNKRKGMILDSSQAAEDAVIQAHVPLSNMFGYSTVLRSATQGKGERGARVPGSLRRVARRGREARLALQPPEPAFHPPPPPNQMQASSPWSTATTRR